MSDNQKKFKVETKCKNCVYWVIFPDPKPKHIVGYCYRYPPVPISDITQDCPVTTDDHWCGEFKAK